MLSTKLNSQKLFSIALILGMGGGTPFLYASDSKIDEKAFQDMIKQKDKERLLIESKHIKKDSTLATNLVKQLEKISSKDKKINVLVTLKTDDIAIEPISTKGEVHIDENGKDKIFVNGKETTIDELKQKEEKFLNYQKKIKKLKKDNTKKSLKKFVNTYKYFERKVLEEIELSDKDYFKMSLSKSEIIQLSKNKDLIMGIDLAHTPFNEIGDAMLSSRVDPYAFYGNEGSGVNIYMSEGACEPNSHTTNYHRLSGSTAEHSEDVLNILRAVSPESFIYCRANFNLPESSDPNVEIQNHSWGDGFDTDYTTRDRDFDNYIIDNNDVIFKSAGNTNLGINVTSPGKGLNVITVGNYDDATDTIFFQSSFGDPQTKNQKPEIVAPGTTIDTDLDGTIDNSGTSFSAPHAGAFAANLMSNYTWMQDKPHLMKAVMLAGATKSISGGADAVGVGGIDFWSAAYNSHMMWWTNASYATNAANDWGTNNNYLEWKVSLTAGNNYRAVISWLNDGDYTYAHRTDSHPIGKDFDLSVWDPNGTWKCGSGSFYNPYEMCQFSTTISGDYTIRIIQYMDRDTSSNMSLAAVVNKY